LASGQARTLARREDKAVPLPRGFSYLPAWPFAAERLDTWVLKVGIAIPLVCLAGLILWHLGAYLAGKLPKKPRTVKDSPEPPSRGVRAAGEGGRETTPARDDPERLQKTCAALEDSLAERYLELAETWLLQGQPQKAVATWKKVLQICPERRQGQVALDRLRQIDNEAKENHS
jgi:hypothetical protein